MIITSVAEYDPQSTGRLRYHRVVWSQAVLSALLTLLVTTTGVLAGDVTRTGANVAPLRVVFFHSPSCHECQKVKDFLPQVTEHWGSRITLELRSIDDINVFDDLLRDDEEKAIGVLKNISRKIPKMALMMGPHATVGSIPEYIMENSWYTKWREILSTSYSNRLLYLFERELKE